jgi:hypothetical protein
MSITFTLLPPFFKFMAAIQGQKWEYGYIMGRQPYPDGEFWTKPSGPPGELSDPPEYWRFFFLRIGF